MTIEKAMKTYRLPKTTTPEKLELMGYDKPLNFGNKVVTAGYVCKGRDKSAYYGIAYEFTTADHTCEGEVELKAVSNDEFDDNGHAVAWAMQQ